MTAATSRTITLTGRPPVRITDAAWPIHAEARADTDTTRHRLFVRRHADGRTIVYGIANSRTTPTRRGGVLLDAPDDAVAAVYTVGALLDMPPAVVERCVAAFPPEPLD